MADKKTRSRESKEALLACNFPTTKTVWAIVTLVCVNTSAIVYHVEPPASTSGGVASNSMKCLRYGGTSRIIYLRRG